MTRYMPHRATTTADLDVTAKRFATLEAAQAETLIDGYVASAIAEWRVDDATFWHRVKFRARMLRAARRVRVAAA